MVNGYNIGTDGNDAGVISITDFHGGSNNGKNVLAADGPLDVEAIKQRTTTNTGSSPLELENILTDIRAGKKYVENPHDALMLANIFKDILSPDQRPKVIMSLLFIVGEYIGNTEAYSMDYTDGGDHAKVNNVYASQAALTQQFHTALEDDTAGINTDTDYSLQLLESTQLSTTINTFLLTADNSERAPIQNVGIILQGILGIENSQTDWNQIMREAQNFLQQDQAKREAA